MYILPIRRGEREGPPLKTSHDEYVQPSAQPPEHSYRSKPSYFGDMPDPLLTLLFHQRVSIEMVFVAPATMDQNPVLNHQPRRPPHRLQQNPVRRLFPLDLQARAHPKVLPQLLRNHHPPEFV